MSIEEFLSPFNSTLFSELNVGFMFSSVMKSLIFSVTSGVLQSYGQCHLCQAPPESSQYYHI